jgi:hypothetical protein
LILYQKRAIKEDITELVALALTNLSFDAVMARIKPMREKGGLLQKQRGPVRRQDLLAKIFEYDAYQVLEYLVNVRIIIIRACSVCQILPRV